MAASFFGLSRNKQQVRGTAMSDQALLEILLFVNTALNDELWASADYYLLTDINENTSYVHKIYTHPQKF